MEIRVLGPLQIVSATGEVTAVQRAKPAAVLAVLLIRARTQVSVDELLHALWGTTPPATAVKTLQTYIAQVRRLLGAARDVLTTTAAGYRLDIPPHATDAGRFEVLVQRGLEQLAVAPAAAHRTFVDALELWRGTPYAEFAFMDFASAEIAHLEELRLTAHEGRIEALLRVGRATEVVSDLHDMTHRHPLREGLWAQLLRALYASGRQAEALGAFTRVRQILARELGVDPGPQLQRLEQQILAQELEVPVAGPPASTAGAPPPTGGAPPPASAPPPTAHAAAPPPADAEQRWVMAVHLCARGGLQAQVERIAAVVHRYEGTVLSTTDDAAVLAFGIPVAHDDDSERAVRCALDLSAAQAPATAAGVAAGEARVDRDQPDRTTAPFTTAERLAASGGSGAVLVDDTVHRMTRRRVRYDATAHGFRASGIHAVPTVLVGQAPLIGRDAESTLLDSLWALTRRAERPHLVTLVGSPGIGKSRLVAEFVRRIAGDEVTVVAGACRPYGDAVFGAVCEVLRDILDVTEHEPVREVRWKIEQWLATFLPADEQPRATEYVVTLLSVLGDIAEIRESTIRSLRRLFELAAAQRPTVVVFENLHWAHPDLLTLVEQTVAQAIGVPLMVIGVTRGELFDARPAWGGGLTGHTALALEPLDPAATRTLAEALRTRAGVADAPLDTAAAGGNPLFVEELVAWELDGHAAGSLPTTLRSVIDARLDALPDSARRTAIDAALVGSPFWPGALAALGHPDREDLQVRLDDLEDRSLIVHRAASTVGTEPEYVFRHDMIAEVAYARVPPDLRPAKHLAVGRWLEAQPDAPPAVLAHHWREAGDIDRAVDYLCAAGDQANTGAQRQRAVVLYQQALDTMEPGDPRWRRTVLRRAVALQAWAHTVLDQGQLGTTAPGPVSPPGPPV